MIPPITPQFISALHSNPHKAVIVTTGGGTCVFPNLLQRGGGSATLLSGLIPYSMAESMALMGKKPDRFVSEEAARLLAMAAFQRALKMRDDDSPVVGIGSTSVLQSTPTEREGRIHAIFVGLQTATQTVVHHLEISPEQRKELQVLGADAYVIREFEEELNGVMILNLLAKGFGIPERLEFGQAIESTSTLTHPDLATFMTGKTEWLLFRCRNGAVEPAYGTAPSICLFPGSFNPMHEGHRRMRELAMRMTNARVDYEISIANVDKPSVDLISIGARLQQIASVESDVHVVVTNAPTFVEKAAIFNGRRFVVGYDTALRIVDKKYGNVRTVLNKFADYLVDFLVFGRTVNGAFENDLSTFPQGFQAIAEAVTEDVFRNDISSTELRSKGA